MSERGYIWWMNRLKHVFQNVDLVRIDHFRGFSAYWEIPSDEKTAEKGRWIDGPGEAFFRSMRRDVGPLPVVAEDLGIITPDVRALKNKLGYPVMAVLQFAFETDATNEYLPHNFDPNVVAYTGTHDNDTLIGWWQSIQEKNRETGTTGVLTRARAYLQVRTNHKNIVWSGIRVLMSSVARIVIVPMQDVLGLGSEARMNTPGKESGNWVWRLVQAPDEDRTAKKLRSLTALYGRSSPPVSR